MAYNAYVIQAEDLEALIDARLEQKLQALQPIPIKKEDDDLLTRRETAQILGVTLPTINAWVHSGKLVAYRIGSRIRFKRSDLETSLKKVQAC